MWVLQFARLLGYYFLGSCIFFTFGIPRAIAQRVVLCCLRKRRNTQRPDGTLQIVCVSGFLAPKRGSGDTWGCLEDMDPSIIFAEISGVLSQHDRACELFYSIKGGRVDYGLEHSKKYGHNRYGDSYAGSYPEWDAQHPIHLIGHSLGGVTARVLQHYLDTRAFPGHKTDGSWIRSINCISAPLNGALATYALGASQDAAPRVNWGSPGFLLGVLAQIWAFLDIPLLNGIYDFGLNSAFNFSHKHGWSAVRALYDTVIAQKGFLHNGDNAAYDMTIDAALVWNVQIRDHSKTYYTSVVNKSKKRGQDLTHFASVKHVLKHAFLTCVWHRTSRYCYDKLHPYEAFSLNEWFDSGSDLLCSVFTQSFPRIPYESSHAVVARTGHNHFPRVQEMRSATWYTVLYSQDHLVITAPDKQRKQLQFYRELLTTLRNLDALLDVPTSRRHSLERARKGSVDPVRGSVCALPGTRRPKTPNDKKRKQAKKPRARA